MLKDLIVKNRSYRRFFESEEISTEDLCSFVDLVRLSPSGANLQALRFLLSNSPEKNKLIFEHLAWAGYLTDWAGPEKGERPSAYIVILAPKEPVKPVEYDVAIACQSILLGAVEKGYGGCIIGSVQRKPLSKKLNLPDHLKISLVIALGKPKEKVVIDPVANNDIKYWRDEDNTHHVPKRALKDLIVDFD